MSKKAKPVKEEVQNKEEEVPQTPTEQPQPQVTLNDMKVGYIVALTKDGDFFFDIFGQQKGLVEILGLHAHASKRVGSLHDRSQTTGDALVDAVGKALALLHQKVDVIQQVVAPKKPDNEIE